VSIFAKLKRLSRTLSRRAVPYWPVGATAGMGAAAAWVLQDWSQPAMIAALVGTALVTGYLFNAVRRTAFLKAAAAVLMVEVSDRKKAQELLQDGLRRTALQRAAISRVSQAEELTSGEIEPLARKITELAAATVGCERVNLWVFNESETILQCVDLYEATPGRHSAGLVLEEQHYRREFEAFKTAKYVAADDPLTDPRTAGYVEGYLVPLGITSMLDTVVQMSGRNLGLLCFEHVGKRHRWEVDEISFANQLADKFAIALVNRMRRQAEESVRTNESKFRTIFNSVSDCIFAHDLESGRIIDVNRRVEEFYGYTREEILAGDVGMLSAPTGPYTQSEALAKLAAARDSNPPPFEWHLKAKNGRLFWGEVTLRRTSLGGQDVILATVRDITERKRASDELRESRQVLEGILNSIPIRVFWKSRDLTYLGCNRAFAVDAGFSSPEEIVGKDDYQMGWRDQADLYRSDDRQVIETGIAKLLIEEPQTTPDGRTITLLTSKMPLRGASGEIEGILGTYWDISERKRVEEALARERDFSAALIDSQPGLFLLMDEQAHLLRWNRNASNVMGVADPQLLWRDALSFVTEVDRTLVKERIVAAFREGTADFEVGVKTGAGSVRTFHFNSTRVGTPENRYLVAVGIDTTEAREAACRVQASEERLRAISQTAQDAIVMADAGARVRFWNPAAERMLGYTLEEATGRSIHDWLRAGTGHDGLAIGEGIELPNKVVELMAVRKDGKEIPVEASFAGVRLGDAWHSVAILRDISDRKRSEEQIARMARSDLLTGLANRSVFVETLRREIARTRRGGTNFAVLYLDLDHFKDVNDTLGHVVGDMLLQNVADRLRRIVRETDMVARFGGDEFAVIQSDISSPQDAATLADKLLKAMGEPFFIAGNDIRIGTSVGIAVHDADSSDPELLLSHADVALYRAKSEGRGTYRYFTDAMDAEVRARVTISGELREAIAMGQLFLVYQPQVDAHSGRIVGVEALVRWRHPVRGIVLPGEFIPIAERTGLIVSLGQWVLREACRQMKAWLDEGLAVPVMAVNMSALQFKVPQELERYIAATVAETGLSPDRLELELTESVLMEASLEHNDLLLRLRQTGIRIAVDDFGMGYSSLDYLRRFPVDRVKIAQNFITDLTETSSNAAIVKAAIGLARELSLLVVVEGVETEHQLDLIKSWGADQVQGYLFSKPLAARDVEACLRAGAIRSASAQQDPASGRSLATATTASA
jgi:diguanylate cyclase (GGDEF)-like protein/PAS domain S-box-containing protein